MKFEVRYVLVSSDFWVSQIPLLCILWTMEDVSMVTNRCYVYLLGNREWQCQQMTFLFLSFFFFFQGRCVLVNETGRGSSSFSDILPSPTLSVCVCVRETKADSSYCGCVILRSASEAFCSIRYAHGFLWTALPVKCQGDFRLYSWERT